MVEATQEKGTMQVQREFSPKIARKLESVSIEKLEEFLATQARDRNDDQNFVEVVQEALNSKSVHSSLENLAIHYKNNLKGKHL